MAHILLVDDDVGVRTAVGRFLRRQEHQVTEAGNGVEALKVAQRLVLDLVLTDINMPDMDGIELILSLREQRPGLPIIAFSGGGRVPKAAMLSDALLLGAVAVLAKPFELSALQAEVDEALAGRPPTGSGRRA